MKLHYKKQKLRKIPFIFNQDVLNKLFIVTSFKKDF